MTINSAMSQPVSEDRPVLRQDLPDLPPVRDGGSYSAKVTDARRLAESCRVIFNMERLRANIQSGIQGEKVSQDDVCDWLEALGFAQSSDGEAWIGRRRTLRHFADGEVVSYESISA